MKTNQMFSLLKPFMYRFASSKKSYFTSNLPYKFGGLDPQEYSQFLDTSNNDLNMHMLQNAINENVAEGFRNAYKEIVNAINEKDKEFLSLVLEKNLLKNVKFPNTKLINNESPIDVRIGKISIIKGGCYDRDILSNLRFLAGHSNEKSVDLKGFAAVGDNPNSNSILFVFHVYFISKMKLVEVHESDSTQASTSLNPEESPVEKSESSESSEKLFENTNEETEIHMLQFESESKHKSLFSILGTAARLYIRHFSNKSLFVTKYLRFLMNADKPEFEWKVGDVDRRLDGNSTE